MSVEVFGHFLSPVKLKHFTPLRHFSPDLRSGLTRIFAELMESEPDTRCICCAAVRHGQGRWGQIFLSACFLTSCRLQSYIIHTNLHIWQPAKVLSSQAYSEFLFLIWQGAIDWVWKTSLLIAICIWNVDIISDLPIAFLLSILCSSVSRTVNQLCFITSDNISIIILAHLHNSSPMFIAR